MGSSWVKDLEKCTHLFQISWTDFCLLSPLQVCLIVLRYYLLDVWRKFQVLQVVLLNYVKRTKRANKPYTMSISYVTWEKGYILISFPWNHGPKRLQLKKTYSSQCGVTVIPQHEEVSDKHSSQASYCKSNRGRSVILHIICSKLVFYFPT